MYWYQEISTLESSKLGEVFTHNELSNFEKDHIRQAMEKSDPYITCRSRLSAEIQRFNMSNHFYNLKSLTVIFGRYSVGFRPSRHHLNGRFGGGFIAGMGLWTSRFVWEFEISK